MQNWKNIKLRLVTKEPLRIGGKKDPLSAADNPVTKVGGRLVIPGSSLKGVLRQEIESFLIDTYYKDGRWRDNCIHFQPCIPGAELSADERRLIAAGKYRNQERTCHYPCAEKQCKNVTHSICPACYLLGAMGLNGFIKVPFLFADGAPSELYSSRMDRGTSTIAQGSNRPYELVPDGAVFEGTMSILIEDTVLGWSLGEPRQLGESHTLGDKWLDNQKIDKNAQEQFINTYILERLQSITNMGGYKSKGFGALTIAVS